METMVGPIPPIALKNRFDSLDGASDIHHSSRITNTPVTVIAASHLFFEKTTAQIEMSPIAA
jgi:hypothetical protein